MFMQGKKPIIIKIELPTNAYFMSGIRDFTLKMIENTTDFSNGVYFYTLSVNDKISTKKFTVSH